MVPGSLLKFWSPLSRNSLNSLRHIGLTSVQTLHISEQFYRPRSLIREVGFEIGSVVKTHKITRRPLQVSLLKCYCADDSKVTWKGQTALYGLLHEMRQITPKIPHSWTILHTRFKDTQLNVTIRVTAHNIHVRQRAHMQASSPPRSEEQDIKKLMRVWKKGDVGVGTQYYQCQRISQVPVYPSPSFNEICVWYSFVSSTSLIT